MSVQIHAVQVHDVQHDQAIIIGVELFYVWSLQGDARKRGRDEQQALEDNARRAKQHPYTDYSIAGLIKECLCITGPGYDAYREQKRAERAAAPQVAMTDLLRIEGVVYACKRAANNNIALVAVEQEVARG